jgi:hypothetical protein
LPVLAKVVAKVTGTSDYNIVQNNGEFYFYFLFSFCVLIALPLSLLFIFIVAVVNLLYYDILPPF